MKTKILLFGMILFLLTFNSCNKDDLGNTSALNAEEANVNAKIDVAVDDVSGIVDEQVQVTLDDSSGKSALNTNDLPSCAVVTRVPAAGTPLTAGQTVTKTINFGTSGCEMPNGNILKGKIIFSFTYEPGAASHTITCSFDNFYHNNVRINGNKTFTRTMSEAPSHPIITMTMNITATFPNGNVYTRTGTRIRETIEGYTSPNLNDNVYQITGNWTTTLPNGGVQVSTITTPLIIRRNCQWIVSGVITIVRNDVTAVLFFGNAGDDCNNEATVTINGVSYPITLGN